MTYQLKGERALLGDIAFKLDYLRAYQAEVQPVGPNGEVLQLNLRLVGGSWYSTGWVVPYLIDASISNSDYEDCVIPGIEVWNEQTDVSFVPYALADDRDDYVRIRFVADLPSHQSDLGRQGGEQDVTLTSNCDVHSVAHELGHTLGMMHEHQRIDRDDFVEVVRENMSISDKSYQANFASFGYYWGQYDYNSIMHYRTNTFGTDSLIPGRAGGGLPIWSFPLGRSPVLSKQDIAGMNVKVAGTATFSRKEAHNSLSIVGHAGIAPNATQHRVGDFNGDGLDDLAAFMQSDGSVFVSLGQPDGSLAPDHYWHSTELCFIDDVCEVGDADGDGDDDIVRIRDHYITVATSDGATGFYTSSSQFEVVASLPKRFTMAHIDGDCREDLVGISEYSGHTVVWVFRSEPGRFVPTLTDFAHVLGPVQFADVDGDRDEDLVGFLADGSVEVWNVTDDELIPTTVSAGEVCAGADHCVVADVDGDRRSDLVAFRPDEEHHLDRVRVALSTGYSFADTVPNLHQFDCRHVSGCLVGDVDGDGRADLIDPITNGDGDPKDSERGRTAGHTYVSLGALWDLNHDGSIGSNDFLTDYVGVKKPIPWQAQLPQSCTASGEADW